MRPVSSSSNARDAPIQRGSSHDTPMSQPDRPMRTNATLNRADARCDAHVGRQRERQTAAGGRAVDRGDHGDAQAAQLRHERGDALLEVHAALHAVRGPRREAEPAGGEVDQVETGAEAATGAGEDQHPGLVVLAQRVERGVQLVDRAAGSSR